MRVVEHLPPGAGLHGDGAAYPPLGTFWAQEAQTIMIKPDGDFMQNFMRTWRLTVFVIATAGLCGLPAGAQEAIGMKLEAAGFVMREANTPKKRARLKTLPPHKFVRRMKDGAPYFIYADPTYCKCALIGSAGAMSTYRDMTRPITPPPGYRDFAGNISGSNEPVEQDIIDDMNQDGDAQMEDDIFNLGPL